MSNVKHTWPKIIADSGAFSEWVRVNSLWSNHVYFISSSDSPDRCTGEHLKRKQREQYRSTLAFYVDFSNCFFYIWPVSILTGWCLPQDQDSLSLWPLVTPVLGNISSGCCEASRQYITLLGEAASSPLTVTDKQRAALRMLDSNGPLPFLQEGMLQVIMEQKIIMGRMYKRTIFRTLFLWTCVTLCQVLLIPSWTLLDQELQATSSANLLLRQKLGSLVNLPNKTRTLFNSLIYRSSIWSCQWTGPGEWM